MSETTEIVETPVVETPTPTMESSTAATDAASLLTGQVEEVKVVAADDKTDKTVEEPQLPEKYEFDIPEGLQIDEKLLAEADPVFRELGLNQEQANKLAGIWASQQVKQQDAWVTQIKDWQGQVKADPDIGGDKFDASLQTANETLVRFGATPEFLKFLGDYGLGSHPEMVKFVVNVGKATAEDRPPPNSGTPAAASMSEGERAYQYADKPTRRTT